MVSLFDNDLVGNGRTIRKMTDAQIDSLLKSAQFRAIHGIVTGGNNSIGRKFYNSIDDRSLDGLTKTTHWVGSAHTLRAGVVCTSK